MCVLAWLSAASPIDINPRMGKDAEGGARRLLARPAMPSTHSMESKDYGVHERKL
jgi:hypothetical protein